MSGWSGLISTYRDVDNVAPALKIVTLAQWILESSRGESYLAKKYLNFGGIKYRKRMKDYATPIDYTGSDGVEDIYCKFANVKNFIDGYWHFIASGPYDGWEKYRDDGAEYIKHIFRSGYAQDPNYVMKVLALSDEAEKLLGLVADVDVGDGEITDESSPQEANASTSSAGVLGRLAILVGHNLSAKGAFAGPPISRFEFDFNTDVANIMNSESQHYNLVSKVFYRPAGLAYSVEIERAYNQIRAWNPSCVLELHFNSSPGATGTEMLYRQGFVAARELARNVQEETLTLLGLTNRGVKPLSPGDRGYQSVASLQTVPTILTEPFFGSSSADCARMGAIGRSALARCYLRGVRDWFVTT